MLLSEQERNQLEDDLEQQIGKNAFDAIEAAILAKLAAKELPEPVAWLAEYGGDVYASSQLHEAYAQGFAAGAASQLAEKPSAFLDVVMDCAYTLQELGGNPVSEFTPLYTRREA